MGGVLGLFRVLNAFPVNLPIPQYLLPQSLHPESTQEILVDPIYVLCIELALRNTKNNQILFLPPMERQTYEQTMTTQGDIGYGRGKPRGHSDPEEGALGI